MASNLAGLALILAIYIVVAFILSALTALGWNLAGVGRHITVWQMAALTLAAFGAGGIGRLIVSFYNLLRLPQMQPPEEEVVETDVEELPRVVYWTPPGRSRPRKRR